MGIAFSYFWNKLEKKVLVLGLDNSGKTSILYRLSIGHVVTTIPTVGFNVETVEYKDVMLRVWDLGGQSQIIPYWRCYYIETACVVFVIDSADAERLPSALSELKLLMDEPELSACCVAVFANKQDLCNALDVSTIANEVSKIMPTGRGWIVLPTSVYKNQGIDDGIKWLYNVIKQDAGNIKKSWWYK